MKNSKLWNIKLYDIKNIELTNNQSEILKLQNLIFNLYNFKWKIINNKKNCWIVWIEMSSMEKTNLEIIYTYFINLLIENQSDKFISINLINKKQVNKINNNFVDIEKLTDYWFDYKSINNHLIINLLKNNWCKNLLNDLLNNINNDYYIKNNYKVKKQKIKLLLNENQIDKNQYNEFLKFQKQKYNNDIIKNIKVYSKLLNKINIIINNNFDLLKLTNEIVEKNKKSELIKNYRLTKKLLIKKWIYINKASRKFEKKAQKQIQKLNNEIIKNSIDNYYLTIDKNWSYKVVLK